MFLFRKKPSNKNNESNVFETKENDIAISKKDDDKPKIEKVQNKFSKTTKIENIKTNSILKDLIVNFCNRDKFIESATTFANEELRSEVVSMIDFDHLYYLFYGDIPSYCKNISKVDYNKDCKTFKILITDVTDLRRSIRFIRRFIRFYDNFLYDFIEEFRKKYIEDLSETDNNYGVIKRLESMLDSFSIDTAYCFNIISNLLYSLDTYYDENPNSVGNKITFTKYDTLKRYYFVHTYSLKGSVKIFNNNTMIFGEINNIMKQYDFIYNFVFGTIICNIQTLKTIFDNIKY